MALSCRVRGALDRRATLNLEQAFADSENNIVHWASYSNTHRWHSKITQRWNSNKIESLCWRENCPSSAYCTTQQWLTYAYIYMHVMRMHAYSSYTTLYSKCFLHVGLMQRDSLTTVIRHCSLSRSEFSVSLQFQKCQISSSKNTVKAQRHRCKPLHHPTYLFLVLIFPLLPNDTSATNGIQRRFHSQD